MFCSPSDVGLYKSFVATSRGGGTPPVAAEVIDPPTTTTTAANKAAPYSTIPGLHDYERQLLPEIAQEDIDIYKDYIRRGASARSRPTPQDLDIYTAWVSSYRSSCP